MSSQTPDTNSGKTFSTYSAFSSKSTTNKTVTRNGKPEVSTQSMESSSSSSSGGDRLLLNGEQFQDDFEALKKSIQSGEAYKRTQRLNHEVLSPRQGQQIYKPQEGTTVIRPTRAPRVHFATEESTKQQQTVENTNNNNGKEPNKMDGHNYKTELYIPIQRHPGDFDDFFKNRWLEHNSSHMDTEFDRKRTEWEARLDEMKRGFFHFSPFSDHHPHIEATSTLQPQSPSISTGPTGKPEFAVRFNVQDFKPEEINVSTKAGKLTISATHEEKTSTSTSRREFKRSVDVPSDVQIGLMRSTLSKDGILSITAPIRPPNYLPEAPANPALQSSSQITQQHANAVSSMPVSSGVVTRQADTGDALNYSLSIAGYQPSEVSVTVDGRKVTVRAKHDESSGSRKVHNEMTKSFDLPPTVNPHHVRSYIKDGATLFIEAHLRDDLAGMIHLVPVKHV